MRIYIKSSAFLLSILLLECLLAPLVKGEERSNGDIIIIGNTSDKQSEMDGYWNGGSRKQGGAASSQANADEEINRYCRSEQRNAYSAYDKFSQCQEVESKAKVLTLKIKDKARKTDRTSCFYRSTGYNQTAPNPWSHRYICIKNAVERQIRKQQYMDDY